MLEQVTAYRRDLHQIPEIRLDVPETAAYIRKVLQTLPCQLLEPIPNSVAAFFDHGKKDTIAFRSDMDALPVLEGTGLSFASRYKGRMHACGHDGHMAMLLGFAQRLAEYGQELPHNVMLIFQPGEESPGGAEPICQSGLFETYHIKRIFGFHLWPGLAKHQIATRAGELMACVSELHITIKGKSAHAAKYQSGIDALEAGVEYIHALYQMEKQMPKDVRRLLRIGVFHSGSVLNVVSDETRLEGTIRAFDEKVFAYLCEQVHAIASKLEQQMGVHFDIAISNGYPVVFNDAALLEQAGKVMDIKLLEEPEMISEDFSHYQKLVPGVFFFLGTGGTIPLHNDHFDFAEDVLLTGMQAYETLSRIV